MRGQTTVYCIGVMQVMLYTFFVKLPILYINESTGEKQSWENLRYKIYKEKRMLVKSHVNSALGFTQKRGAPKFHSKFCQEKNELKQVYLKNWSNFCPLNVLKI